ncbi:DNA-directed RNA polymerase sigma-70 factor [Streptomyces sp. XM4193]|uniref:DNA-directed RNA polymerase sigma-70 factor n=1 Tax=Streptomyces sp. XM4193 TaxID=2929782 RepID=UPI001FF75B51|nr:DNA-directed RNA polymerase sigma-70 factor [Streptomyces sp. XM4193]MCK1795530.1 DNA-directed RNA polymerase sigma-70 factor [Streptomyces sp. XM4193]
MTLDDRTEPPAPADRRQSTGPDRQVKARKAKKQARKQAKQNAKRRAEPDASAGKRAADAAGPSVRIGFEGPRTSAPDPDRLVGAGTPRWARRTDPDPKADTHSTPTDRASRGRVPNDGGSNDGGPNGSDGKAADREDVPPRAGSDRDPAGGAPNVPAPADSPAPADTTGPALVPAAANTGTEPPAASRPAPSGPAEPSEPAETGPEDRKVPVKSEATAAEPDPAARAFDLLHITHSPALTRQAYLLTGNREVARWAVERAFHTAWERWPEVARDPDPAGWTRAATHEYALSPWLRFWPGHGAPDPYDGAPEHRAVLEAFWGLPRNYRRTVLLHDGIGLSLAETAAETEASTGATLGRLRHGREAMAVLVQEIADAGTASGGDGEDGPGGGSDGDLGSELRGAALGELLRRAAAAHRVGPDRTPAVRPASEHVTRRGTLAAAGLTAVLVLTTSFSIATGESGDLLPTGLPAAVAQLAR